MLYSAVQSHQFVLCPDILKRGGNAADAAVAIAAALAVTEPCSTGLGGDAFCLFYSADTGEIRGINGRWTPLYYCCYTGSCRNFIPAPLCVHSGRSAQAQTLDFMESRGFSAQSPPSVFDALNVTVPGAPACWCDTVELFGSQKVVFFCPHQLSFSEMLQLNVYKCCYV